MVSAYSVDDTRHQFTDDYYLGELSSKKKRPICFLKLISKIMNRFVVWLMNNHYMNIPANQKFS